MKRFAFTIALLLLVLFARAQEVTDPRLFISDLIEDLVAGQEEEVDVDALTENLMFLWENPINLNQTTYDELSQLPFLTDFQVRSLLDYVDSSGAFLSVYELQLVYGFSPEVITRVLPFVTVSPKAEQQQRGYFSRLRHEAAFRATTLIETPRGYSNEGDGSYYPGSKMATQVRYSGGNRKHILFGWVAEKDAGEQAFAGDNPYGFDYNAFYLQVKDIGVLKNAVAGDFNAGFGQGLTLWSGLSFGRGSDPMGIRKRQPQLAKHSSANEAQRLRGGGATLAYKNFDVTIFGSYRVIDARIDTNFEARTYSSFPTSGLHRTASEVSTKRQANEAVFGANIGARFKRFNVGITAVTQSIDGDYSGGTRLYQSVIPSPVEARRIGANFDVLLGKHLLFGEVATDHNGTVAAVFGGVIKPAQLVDLSVLARSYPANYASRYTAGMGAGSGTSNEEGVMVGIKFLPAKGWAVSALADFYRFPWMTYQASAPTTGHEYLIEATYSRGQRYTVNFRYRTKQWYIDQQPEGALVKAPYPVTKSSARVQFNTSIMRRVSLRTRWELSEYQSEVNPTTYGSVVYQDVTWSAKRIPLSLSARFALFDTDSWDTRIYAYESDVLYSFSVPAYYSQGTRVYLMAKYELFNRVDIWLRWAQTYYSDMEELGSGYDLISSSTRSDVKLLIRVKI